MAQVDFQAQQTPLTANIIGLWQGAEIVPTKENKQFTGSRFRVFSGELPPFDGVSTSDIRYGNFVESSERTPIDCLMRAPSLKFIAISLGGTMGSREGPKKLLGMPSFALYPKGGDASDWSRTTGLKTANWLVIPPIKFSSSMIIYDLRTWKQTESNTDVNQITPNLGVIGVPKLPSMPPSINEIKNCTMTQVCDMVFYSIFNEPNVEMLEIMIWYAVANGLSKFYENLVCMMFCQGVMWRRPALIAMLARSNPPMDQEFVRYLAKDLTNINSEPDDFLDLFVNDIAKDFKFGGSARNWKLDEKVTKLSDLFREPWVEYFKVQDCDDYRDIAFKSLQDPSKTPAFNSVRTVGLTLTHGLIASMVGAIPVLIDGREVKVTLNTEDIIEPGAVLRSAEHGSDDLSDEAKDRARGIVKNALVNGPGVTFKHTPEQIDSTLRGKNLIMPPLGGSAIVNNDGSRITFTGMPILETNVEIFEESQPLNRRNIFKQRYAKGMRSDAFSAIGEYLQSLNPVVMSRVIAVGRHYNHVFKMKPNPTSTDILAFHALVAISAAAPSALKYSGITFTVTNGAIYWDICEKFMRMSANDGIDWNLSPRNKTYVLRPYQAKAVNDLVNSKNNVDIVWLPPGAGKTLIIMEYFRKMCEKTAATKYFIWTTVPEAASNLMEQLADSGLPFNLLSFNAGGNQTFYEKRVNIILHDHLAKIDMIRQDEILTNSTIVIDEFHKCMGKSLRSDAAHELTKIAVRTILMTGTIVRDLKTPGELVEYLASGVRFPVTTHNYVVALGKVVTERVPSMSMISTDAIECNGNALERMVEDAKKIVRERKLGVFICVDTVDVQNTVANLFTGFSVYRIGTDGKPSWGPDYLPVYDSNKNIIPGAVEANGAPQIVITTKTHAAGYEMNRYVIMFMLLFKSNDATRRQLFGRIDRQTNIAKTIEYVTYFNTCDLVMMQNYTRIGDFADTLNDLQSGEGGRKYSADEGKKYTDEAKKRAENARRERERYQRENKSSASHGPVVEAHIILGLDPKSRPSKSELSSAFRKNALKFHPDKFMDTDETTRLEAEENMKRINNANDLLKSHYDY